MDFFGFRSLGTPQSVGDNSVFADATSGSFKENCYRLDLGEKQKKLLCESSEKLMSVRINIRIVHIILFHMKFEYIF